VERKKLSFGSVASRPDPEGSVLAKLVPLPLHPSVLLYGHSKVGKTRLMIYETAVAAKAMNRRAMIIYTEANVERADIGIALATCATHGVACEVVKTDTLHSVAAVMRGFASHVERAFRRGKVPESAPRVVLVDSLSALSGFVTERLGEDMPPPGVVAHQNVPQMALFPRLRRALADYRLNGYLFIVAHETKTRGEPFNPAVSSVKSKPRYGSATEYIADADIYMTDDVPSSLRQCKAWKEGEAEYGAGAGRAGIVVFSRRAADVAGKGMSFFLASEPVSAEGYYYEEVDKYGAKWVFVPEEIATDDEKKKMEPAELESMPAVKVTPACGPRKV